MIQTNRWARNSKNSKVNFDRLCLMFLVQTTVYYQILTRRLNVFVSVLDGKSAQNLSILFGGSLKYLSYDDIKRAILHCDESVLSDSVLQQLIQYMPTPEQLKKLEEYKEQYDSLAEVSFLLNLFLFSPGWQLASIKRLVQRLKSISFRQHYNEMVQDIKPVSFFFKLLVRIV